MPTKDPRFDDDPMATIAVLRGIQNDFYWRCFRSEVGSNAHAFIEFCGLMGKYIDVLQRAAEQGVHPRLVNEHCQVPIRVEMHDMRYLGEKLRCIFGPIIDANPEAREVLRKELFG